MNPTLLRPMPVIAFFLRAGRVVAFMGMLGLSAYGQPAVTLSPSSLSFGTQSIGTDSTPQTVTLTNTGSAILYLTNILVAGSFSGDFFQSNNCPPSLSAGARCSINVTFAPTGTGGRTGSVLFFDNASNSPQRLPLSGPGLGTITNISDSAYQLLTNRVTANHRSFYVYLDADSGFNHGFPFFFGNGGPISIDVGCLDNPADLNVGCFGADDTTDFDGTRGTVLRVTLGPYSSGDFSGLNIEDPGSNSYDLRPATTVTFDIRSPNGATVLFGIGGCVTAPIGPIGLTWSTITINLDTDLSCQPNLASLGILFSVQAGYPYGGTALVDNVQFTPVPSRENQGGETLSFPLATQTFGVVPQQNPPISPDQNNRNVTTIYQSALTLLALLHRGSSTDITNALQIAKTFDYALFYDNHGDPLPQAPGNGCYGGVRATQCGMHNAYESGDIGLFNSQGAGQAQAGDVRLAGFEVPTQPPTFDLVLDGATGGNNAFAILALAAAYEQSPSQNMLYLNDALAIGNWIVANLTSGEGYGGFYVGFPDMGCVPKTLIASKSTENNADIFAAFSLLAQIEAALGNSAAAAYWTSEANIAGNFVLAMFDMTNGRFYAGTVSSNAHYGQNGCPVGSQLGTDILNTNDFLDADSFPTLELAGSAAFGVPNPGHINWQLPTEYVLNFSSQSGSFTQTVMAGGLSFSGFDLVPAPPTTGVAWEFTGQMVGTCGYVDTLYSETNFQGCVSEYQNQILQAANSAPFGDGVGVVASTLPNGDTLPPLSQCLQTPFQCIPERVGLAATNWAIFSDLGYDPLSFPALTVSLSGTGSGTVVSQDGFINCGTVCSYSYYSGSQVILTASPARGSSFSGWTGCDSQNGNTCMVTVVSSRSVTAVFSHNPVYYELSVSTLGDGAVTSADGFIDCPGTCSYFYLSNTQVTLNATPGQGWVFGGWNGACAGTSSCNVTMTQPLSVDAIFSQALQFVAVTPCRLVDTRRTGGPIQGGSSRNFPVLQEGGCTIPTDAAAYSLNVTVVPHGPLGYLTIWPAGEGQPVVSTMNSVDGRVKADAAIVPAGSSGEVSVYVTNTTDVILDIDGYFAPVSGSTYAFYPLPPCRVADTRKSDFPQGLGPPQLFALTPRDFPVLNSTCIPSGVSPTAYSFNFTVVPGGHSVGYLSAWPTGQSQPVVSTLNDQTGTIVANAAIVPAGTGGDIFVYSTDDTQLVIDINGYFAPGPGGLSLYAVAPCRVIDTRHVGSGQPFSGTLSPPVDVVDSACQPPAAAQAYVFNATVVPTGGLGYLTLWPDGTDQPVVSTLNAFDGALTNNMAIVPTNNGKVDAFANGLTQLILDISSYFAP